MSDNFATDADEDERCTQCRLVEGFDDLPLKVECVHCQTFKRWEAKVKRGERVKIK